MNIGPNTTFVLVNDGAGDDVTDAVLTDIAAAIDHVLKNAFRAAWGGSYSCRAGSPTIGKDEVQVSIQGSSDIQGAAGYHTDEAIYVFRDGLPSLNQGAFSLSVVASHEIFEAAGDPGANRWADAGNGTEVAIELCDAVEGFFFEPVIDAGQLGHGVSVSDFLLPSFFDPGGTMAFSHTNKPFVPMQTASDNGLDYQIVRRVNESGEQQVTASGAWHEGRNSAKKHPSSRSSRRGLTHWPHG